MTSRMISALLLVIIAVFCESTLGPCPDFQCTEGGHVFCHPVPCPAPSCKNAVTPPGGCCPHCPNPEIGLRAVYNTLGHGCPNPCYLNGKPTCVHPPCPLPPCVDSIAPNHQCCAECPNGPNCLIEGKIYPAFKNTTDHGKVCRCLNIGPQGTGVCS